MLKDFKAFILRGNVLDLAVAVIIGAAFGAVITAVVNGLITPLIAIPGNAGSLSREVFVLGGSVFLWGNVLNEIINFVIIAAVIFFGVVRPANSLMNKRKTEPAVVTTTRDCPHCLSSIPQAATRCAFCTATVSATG